MNSGMKEILCINQGLSFFLFILHGANIKHLKLLAFIPVALLNPCMRRIPPRKLTKYST
jgi:hypothetical protein